LRKRQPLTPLSIRSAAAEISLTIAGTPRAAASLTTSP